MSFIQKVSIPHGWAEDDARGLVNCVVLKHQTYGSTTINTQNRLYCPGSCQPNPHQLTMTYKGKGWEQRIVNDATAQNAGFWNAA